MDWKERLKALVLETYQPGSTRTTTDVDGVGSTRKTPPQADRTVTAILTRMHQQKPKPRKP